MAIELPIGLSNVAKVWATFCAEFKVVQMETGYHVSSSRFENTLFLKSAGRQDVGWLFQVLRAYPTSKTADELRKFMDIDQSYAMVAGWDLEPLTTIHVALRKYSSAPASNLMWHLLARMPRCLFALLAKVTVQSIQKEIDKQAAKLGVISMLDLSSAVFKAWYDAFDDASTMIGARHIPFRHRAFPYFKGVLGWDDELLDKYLKPVFRNIEDDEFSSSRDLSVESALILAKSAMDILDHEFFSDALSQLVAPVTEEQHSLRKAFVLLKAWPARELKLAQSIAECTDATEAQKLNKMLSRESEAFEQATALCKGATAMNYLVCTPSST